jgi:hypothetical protein
VREGDGSARINVTLRGASHPLADVAITTTSLTATSEYQRERERERERERKREKFECVGKTCMLLGVTVYILQQLLHTSCGFMATFASLCSSNLQSR